MSVCLASALTVLASLPKTRGETRASRVTIRPEEPGAVCLGEQLITKQSSGLEFGSQDTQQSRCSTDTWTPAPRAWTHDH